MTREAKALKLAIHEAFQAYAAGQGKDGLPEATDHLVEAIEKLIEAKVRDAISLG